MSVNRGCATRGAWHTKPCASCCYVSSRAVVSAGGALGGFLVAVIAPFDPGEHPAADGRIDRSALTVALSVEKEW